MNEFSYFPTSYRRDDLSSEFKIKGLMLAERAKKAREDAYEARQKISFGFTGGNVEISELGILVVTTYEGQDGRLNRSDALRLADWIVEMFG